MDSVDIVRVDPADEALLADLHRLHHAVHNADRPDHPRPLWKPFLARVRQDNREMRTELLAARVDGKLVGRALIGWPVIDNQHLVGLDLEVIPSHRRRGVGRALLAEVRHRRGRSSAPLWSPTRAGRCPADPRAATPVSGS